MLRRRRDVNFDSFAPAYAHARRLSDEAENVWRAELAPYFSRASRVVDIGAGTGIWARALARWYGSSVVGVDPSFGMLREARRDTSEAGVGYVRGVAHRMPLQTGCCDRAWFSTVVDHFVDFAESAREAGRILAPDGLALIRDAFADHLDDVTVFRYFPEAEEVARDTGLTFDEVVTVFGEAGFEMVEVRRVAQETAPNLRSYLERMRLRANSNLQVISDDAFSRGLERIERDASRSASPVSDRLDLVVLRRSDRLDVFS